MQSYILALANSYSPGVVDMVFQLRNRFGLTKTTLAADLLVAFAILLMVLEFKLEQGRLIQYATEE